jgi:hypothetical protein
MFFDLLETGYPVVQVVKNGRHQSPGLGIPQRH